MTAERGWRNAEAVPFGPPQAWRWHGVVAWWDGRQMTNRIACPHRHRSVHTARICGEREARASNRKAAAS